jgi:hypothetical protein
MISLSRSDGARTEILRRVTHQPPKEVIEGYTHFEWAVVCAEVVKLKLDLPLSPPPPSPTSDRAPVVCDDCVEPAEKFGTAFGTDALSQERSPGNLSASGALFQRGVGDLKAAR